MSLIRIEAQTDCVHVVLNRPKKLNALSPELLEQFIQTMRDLRTHSAKLIVLRGEGRAFSAGADLMAFSKGLMGPNALAVADLGRQAAAALKDLQQLTLALIDGPCVGGGLVLALSCDLRWTIDGSSFSMPELPTGIPVGWGGLEHMVKSIGMHHTKELIYSGKTISAQTALHLGLVGHIFDTSNKASHAIKALTQVPDSTLRATQSQLHAIEQGSYQSEGDAQIMVNATQDPVVVQQLLSKWQTPK